MDIYIKKLGKNPQVVNGFYGNGDLRPFFLTKEEVDEFQLKPYDMICWEGDIIPQIWENKYGWFDMSKDLIDIGAGAGEYPIYAGFNHSYAFEPNKRKQCLIYTNMLSCDKINDIDVLPYAISDNPGVRNFSGWSEDMNSHSRKDPSMIEYRTLDSFAFDNVGLIKIDIEGFEYHALNSGIGTIIRNGYPPLLIEVWSEKQLNFFFNDEERPDYIKRQQMLLYLLKDLGYVMILDPRFGDWETYFFIHNTKLNGYENPQESY